MDPGSRNMILCHATQRAVFITFLLVNKGMQVSIDNTTVLWSHRVFSLCNCIKLVHVLLPKCNEILFRNDCFTCVAYAS